MVSKVYFRLQNGKAVSATITNNVNYQKAIDLIVKQFNIPKQKISLMYDGQKRTGDFVLNQELPHHIVHVVEKKAASTVPFNLLINIPSGNSNQLKTIKVEATPNTTVKQFIQNVAKHADISETNSSVFHLGKKLGQDTTLEDHQIVGPTQNPIILLGTAPDPSDVQTVANMLSQIINPKVLAIRNQFASSSLALASLTPAINTLIGQNFFNLYYYNKYQTLRQTIHTNIYQYAVLQETGGQGDQMPTQQ